MKLRYLPLVLLLPWVAALAHAQTETEIKNPSVSGGVNDGKVRLTIEGSLGGQPGEKDKLIFSTALQQTIKINREKITSVFSLTLDILQGDPKELPLTISGEGEIKQVTGEALQDWSIRQQTDGTRVLLLRPKKGDKPLTQLAVTVVAERDLKGWKNPLSTLTLTPPQPVLFSGYVKVEATPELDVQPDAPSALLPVETKFLPQALRNTPAEAPEPLSFQFHGSAFTLPLKISIGDPDLRQVVLRDFKLSGTLTEQSAAFVLSATARVQNPKGGTLVILSGGLALTELPQHPDWQITAERGRFVLTFEKAGEFPLAFKFNAAVRQSGPWNVLDFRVASSALQPIVLQGLPADTEFQFVGAARPVRTDKDFTTFLPPDGSVRLAWKTAAPETEGKLFYSAEMFSQITVAPGLTRQLAILDGKIMQGELEQVTLLLRGAGEVTNVAGGQVLTWKMEPGADPQERRLVVQFNQPQKGQFSIHVHTQTPIGAFPQTIDALQIRPEGATRFAGYFRIVNEGAVRLEIGQSKGLSQISPEQFPETDVTKAVLRASGAQRFAYRFSGADFALRIQADQILPELTVSEVLAYRLGATELSIDAEIELDVREAPLRELLLRVPRGYAVARLNAPGQSDYFLRDLEEPTDAELRIVYAQPVSGRQVVQLRLERNQALGAAEWTLPRIDVIKAKSVRGHVAISADTGFRLTPILERTQGLTEMATAFFPRKVTNIQTAFRISEPTWQAVLRVERLPQSIQADGFHLFSIGEGVAYGSSVLNYVVSGSPISAFKVDLSAEYFNVEFTGKDIRNWQKTDTGFTVYLHSPVTGAYTLLATYERPFKPQGDTLTFTGARPLDAQSEQGHTLIISAYQFQVNKVDVSPNLLRLETGEVPPEYRLFFDEPLLAAYRYTGRPFNLKLALSPLAQGDSLSQVADRASLTTRISKEGNAVTDAVYFVKNRGNAHFSVTLPPGVELWLATVNDVSAVPVKDGNANLIPLPQQADPNAVLAIRLKLAEKAKDEKRVKVASPIVGAPVLLGEWRLEPDTAQRLIYREGSLTPVNETVDVSGFARLGTMFKGPRGEMATLRVLAVLVLLGLALFAWRNATRGEVYKYSSRFWMSFAVGGAAFLLAVFAVLQLIDIADRYTHPVRENSLSFVAPVQEAGRALTVEVDNVEAKPSSFRYVGYAWPALFALLAFGYAWVARQPGWKVIGWTLLSWAALRCPDGVELFLGVFLLFTVLHLAIPALRKLWSLPRKPKPATPPPATDGGPTPAAATAALLLLGCLWLGSTAQAQDPALPKAPPVAETVTQQVRVEDKFVLATAKVRWQAVKGQQLPVIYNPAVLTKITYPNAALKLVPTVVGGRGGQALLALENGAFDIELQYQVPVAKKDAETGFMLPSQFGLVNELTLTLVNLDVDVVAPLAVSIDRNTVGKDTVAKLVLTPANEIWIAWKPRSRDVTREKPLFFAEFTQLYTPTVGVVEGLHHVAIRPAKGELSELVFTVPKGTTITDVLDPASFAPVDDGKKVPVSIVQQWRFDPDAGKLRVNLAPPQSRNFSVLIRSQIATGPLPVTQAVGLISIDGSDGQGGFLGIATGNEVQLDDATADKLSSINIEDFPPNIAPALAGQIPGIAVRRAYRYADIKSSAVIKASAVEPDVRVESQDTLSLGEDRVLLAVNATVDITRAGIFRLSFALPTGMDVESISGPAVSHWTEQKTEATRIITMHLRGRTEGQQQFAITLAGPGLKATKGWTVPQLIFREASKQGGTFLVVPEQGMRLQVATRADNVLAFENLTQLDPQKSGIKQKGVLAFRVLGRPWSLVLDIEQVEPWVQVNTLQHATVGEAQVRVVANLQYQIENTGMKAFHVALPVGADNVKFDGDEVADSIKMPNAVDAGMQMWEVKLHRRKIGGYALQATYQLPMPPNAQEISLRGVQVSDVNLQRGFVTVQAGGRLQVRVEATPAALQPTEWQSIPRILQKDLTTSSASYAYRLVEPAFTLPMKLVRHAAAQLLAARVNSITFTSVISDNGAMLTQVNLQMIPGDMRLLALTLPKDAKFWFAFVNQNGVWPWREGEKFLIPLDQQVRSSEPVPVTLFYSSQAGSADTKELDLQFFAPKFELPLENITWNVYLNEKWKVNKWTGTLQLQGERVVGMPSTGAVQTYLRGEADQMQQKSEAAHEMLARGTTALAQGNPQEARRAFESAYGLSQHDNAFNEDARVQLHNLKLQQALVGLNVRNNTVTGTTDAVTGKLRATGGDNEANYTQQDAKDLMGRNSVDENAAFTKLAERLIQQQDAAISNPATIKATIPEQGRLLTFSRTVAVDNQADLHIGLEAKALTSTGNGRRLLILIGIAVILAVFAQMAGAFRRKEPIV
jgi:hypothetical protein